MTRSSSSPLAAFDPEIERTFRRARRVQAHGTTMANDPPKNELNNVQGAQPQPTLGTFVMPTITQFPSCI